MPYSFGLSEHGSPPHSGATVSRSYVLDTTNPNLTVSLVGDNAKTASEATAAGGVISVTAETGSAVSVVLTGSDGSVAKSLTATGSAQTIALTAGDLTTLGQGSVGVATTATDAAGNVRFSGSGGFILDTVAPSLSVAAVGDAAKTEAEATFAGGVITVNAEIGSVVTVDFAGTSGNVTKTLSANGTGQAVTLMTFGRVRMS